MYVKLTNNQPSVFPYSLNQIRRDNPGTSFPETIPDSTLASYDVYPVIETPAPNVDMSTHTLSTWVELVDSAWTQTWQMQPLPQTDAANNIRAERNRRLTACDWTQLPDAPVDTALWTTYRQELRDITKQSDFPWSINWPVHPLG